MVVEEIGSDMSNRQSGQDRDEEDLSFSANISCHCLQKFHKKFNNMFSKMGYRIATTPSYFIVIPLFITLLGLTGVQQMKYEKDPEYLFSPTSGEGRTERVIVEKYFPINYSEHFDQSRFSRLRNFARLLVSAKDGGTMFRVKVWDEMVTLDSALRNLTIIWQNDSYSYKDICAQMNKTCIDNQVFNLNDFMEDIENGSMTLNYPIMLFPNVLPFFYGGPVINESEGVLTATAAISLNYWFRADNWKQTERSYIFEGKILEFLDSAEFEYIKVAHFVSRSLEDELDKTVLEITPYLGFTVTLLVFFSVGSVFMADCVRNKVPVAIFGVLSATFSTISAFGFLMYCGVPFIGINMAAPFLMLGIGIDDMFVVLSAWHLTKIQDEVPKRLAGTYYESAVSITITSLTNMLSFFVGACTPFPAVRIFCIYTGISILFTYVYSITFFGGCLAIAGYQERKQKHAVTCRPVLPRSQAEKLGCCYRVWCTGGINREDPWNPEDNKTHVVMAFFRDYFGKTLSIPFVKILVIFSFLVYLAGAIYGCTKVQEGLQRRRLALDTSYLVDYFDTEDKFFRDYPYRLQIIINQDIIYSDPATKKSLLELHENFENLKYIAPGLFTDSWIRGFYKYLDRRPQLKENITDEVSFIRFLRTEYLIPGSPEYLDVLFNEDETRILASRFIIQGYKIKDSVEDMQMMTDVRRVADEAPFSVIAYHPFFVFFDQYLLVRTTSIQTISLAAIIMILVSLVFIPNPLCSLWVALSIISIEVGVIGYMSLWDVSLDSISMINLIMCIGFSVDFSAHISYAYLTARGTSPTERIRECLYTLGLPVLQGGLSTITGVLVLVVAPSYIFTTFFKIVFLVIFLGIMHALLLLPVMLSLLGPGSCSKQDTDDFTIVRMPILPPHCILKKEDFMQIEKVINISQIDPDEESVDKDQGLGSSGSSSQSSLHEEMTRSIDTEEYDSSKKVWKVELFNNEGFIPDHTEDTIKLPFT